MFRKSVRSAAFILLAGVTAAQAAAPVRILCLGDSYTAGTAIDPAKAWPAVMAKQLRAGKRDIAAPTVIAREGWTAEELLAALDAARPEGPYDVVTLMIGVNNQYRGASAADFRPKLIELVGRAIALAGGRPPRVILITVPDYSVTPYGQRRDPAGTRKAIEDYNRTIEEVSKLYGLRLADVEPISVHAANNPGLTAEDGLHPSARMHNAWGGLIHAEVNRALLDFVPKAR